jgi:hypothetical protein
MPTPEWEAGSQLVSCTPRRWDDRKPQKYNRPQTFGCIKGFLNTTNRSLLRTRTEMMRDLRKGWWATKDLNL